MSNKIKLLNIDFKKLSAWNTGRHICFAVIIIALVLTSILSEGPIVIFLGKCIAFAIVAIGLDLIWGYTGILSLGH